MSTIAQFKNDKASVPVAPRRSIHDLLAPLNRLAEHSVNLVSNPFGWFKTNDETHALPRYLFIGPPGGGEPIRIGLFAAIHGDDPVGTHALIRFLIGLEQTPQLAKGFCLFAYPVCNPTGFEANTRCSLRGRDLNREFWLGSTEPEVLALEVELRAQAFHGLIALRSDATSQGMYGYVSGATLTKHLLRPALDAAELVLPRNQSPTIAGLKARDGVIHERPCGVLSAPPKVRPRPFESTVETPGAAPQYFQEQALVAALQTILNEYPKLVAYAANL